MLLISSSLESLLTKAQFPKNIFKSYLLKLKFNLFFKMRLNVNLIHRNFLITGKPGTQIILNKDVLDELMHK